MIRGEFIFEDGTVITNQFTIYGMQRVLRSAFHGIKSTWHVGLCAHNPADAIALINVNEPSVANGYERQSLLLNQTNWPTLGTINGESYIESRAFTFDISAEIDVAVNRLFLTDSLQVLAVSSPIQDGLVAYDSPFSTKYRLYFR